jgi:hypothetical protein
MPLIGMQDMKQAVKTEKIKQILLLICLEQLTKY